jgi:hypothetical protein
MICDLFFINFYFAHTKKKETIKKQNPMYAIARQKPKHVYNLYDENGELLILPGQAGESEFRNTGPKAAAKKAIRRYAKAMYGKNFIGKEVQVNLMNKSTGKMYSYSGYVRYATPQDKLSKFARENGLNTVVVFTEL